MSSDAPSAFGDRAAEVMGGIQEQICGSIEDLEAEAGGNARFGRDRWERPGGGGGLTRVLVDGRWLEKGGVSVSIVHGELDAALAEQLPGSGRHFFATGVSLVLHPRNPHVPAAHANFRFIARGDTRWFGGGADLTPCYFYAEDKTHFHETWRQYCEAHGDLLDYSQLRDACDRYFYLPHRGERRGVGGIFFDNLQVESNAHGDALLALIRDGGKRFIDAYLPIVRRRMGMEHGDAERRWQELRRGRYVEFNLLHDRGTVFGLRTGGRTESILISLPPRVRWGYAEEPAAGTAEARLLEELRQPPPGDP